MARRFNENVFDEGLPRKRFERYMARAGFKAQLARDPDNSGSYLDHGMAALWHGWVWCRYGGGVVTSNGAKTVQFGNVVAANEGGVAANG